MSKPRNQVDFYFEIGMPYRSTVYLRVFFLCKANLAHGFLFMFGRNNSADSSVSYIFSQHVFM